MLAGGRPRALGVSPLGVQVLSLDRLHRLQTVSNGSFRELERPIYSCKASLDGLSKAISGYFESGIQLLQQSIIELIYEKDSEAEEKYTYREEHIPNFKINILLSIFKTLNIIFHVDVFLAQKVIECHALFMETLRFIFEYTKENFQESV